MPRKSNVKVEETVKAVDSKVKETAKVVDEKAKEVVDTVVEKGTEVAKKAEEAVANKTAEVKSTVKKAATTKETVKPEIIVQYQNNEVDINTVQERVKNQFVSEGHKAGTIKKMNVYIKPEEYSAYYVINDKFSGRVDLF